jgi:DamX protein
VVVASYVGWQRLSSSLDKDDRVPELASVGPQQEIPLPLPEPPARANLFRTRPLPLAQAGAPGEPLEKTVDEMAPTQHVAATLRDTNPDTTAEVETPVEPVVAPLAALQQPPTSVHPIAAEPRTEEAPQEQPVTDLATTEPDQGTVTDTIAAAPVSRAETADAKVRSDTASSTSPHREDWLLQQPAKLYSLQLLGTRSEKSVARFIEDNGLDLSQAAYYRGNFKDSEWFVLLYGLYPSRDDALKARERLPASVRKGKPWPRSLESVHSAIREVRP